jgi:hypothetical protein
MSAMRHQRHNSEQIQSIHQVESDRYMGSSQGVGVSPYIQVGPVSAGTLERLRQHQHRRSTSVAFSRKGSTSGVSSLSNSRSSIVSDTYYPTIISTNSPSSSPDEIEELEEEAERFAHGNHRRHGHVSFSHHAQSQLQSQTTCSGPTSFSTSSLDGVMSSSRNHHQNNSKIPQIVTADLSSDESSYELYEQGKPIQSHVQCPVPSPASTPIPIMTGTFGSPRMKYLPDDNVIGKSRFLVTPVEEEEEFDNDDGDDELERYLDTKQESKFSVPPSSPVISALQF